MFGNLNFVSFVALIAKHFVVVKELETQETEFTVYTSETLKIKGISSNKTKLLKFLKHYLALKITENYLTLECSLNL